LAESVTTPEDQGVAAHCQALAAARRDFAAIRVQHESAAVAPAVPEKTYGHSVKSAHRADVVEYRIEQHKTKLGDCLSRMFAVTSGKQRKVRTVA